MSNLDYLIDRLEELLHSSPRLPLTGKLMLDEDSVMRIVEQLRSSIPAEIREAQQLLQDRDAIVEGGQEKANNIVTLAQEQADRMVEESSILMRADQERRGILERAEADAHRIRQAAAADAERTRGEADAYALDVLRDLERSLASFQRTIANGIAMLRESQQAASRPRPPAQPPPIQMPPAKPAAPVAPPQDDD
ncbi:MAG: hypothetical protein U0641_16285 [Anaerolineae bacterium]